MESKTNYTHVSLVTHGIGLSELEAALMAAGWTVESGQGVIIVSVPEKSTESEASKESEDGLFETVTDKIKEVFST